MRINHPVLVAAAIGGTVGLSVALGLAFVIPYEFVPLSLRFMLWPAFVFEIFDLGSASTAVNIMKYVGMFGGNALIYAVVAAVPVALASAVRDFFNKSKQVPPSIKFN
jgi:hypothetical protein